MNIFHSYMLIKLLRASLLLILFLLLLGTANYFIVRAGCEDGGGGPAESLILIPSVYACGDSGYTGGGDSAGSGGGGNSDGGVDTEVGGGNNSDGGSGGGSNQNHSGDEGNNNSPTEDTGYNCGTECAAPVLSATTTCEGTQPVVNLSWSGVPTPTSANWFLGSTSFLMRSPRIYTGVLVPFNVMRTYGVAYFPYGNFSFKDTYREYWIPAYTIPAWTEITGTDENGNPTGSVDHPATDVPAQLALTDTVTPNTTYLYQIYASNASAAITYSSSGGYNPSLTYNSRTLLSDIVSVTTLPCDGSPIPSPSVNPPANPQINLNITTDTNTYYSNDLPASVKQSENATLNWNITNADSCTADSSQSFWDGSLTSFSGSESIDTSNTGTLLFNVDCSNSSGTTSASIQLNIALLRPPFIQTTGGDVHTNETFNITPSN